MKSDWKTFLADFGAEFEGENVAHYGNPVHEREVALSGLVFADLGYQGVIGVHGADAGSFLQTQLSNDVSQLDDGSRSQLDAYCTPKGRMLGLMRVFRQGDSYYLRLPLDTLEAVLQRLRMYVLRAAVTLEDATDNFLRIGVSGAVAGKELQAVAGVEVLEGAGRGVVGGAVRVPDAVLVLVVVLAQAQFEEGGGAEGVAR